MRIAQQPATLHHTLSLRTLNNQIDFRAPESSTTIKSLGDIANGVPVHVEQVAQPLSRSAQQLFPQRLVRLENTQELPDLSIVPHAGPLIEIIGVEFELCSRPGKNMHTVAYDGFFVGLGNIKPISWSSRQ